MTVLDAVHSGGREGGSESASQFPNSRVRFLLNGQLWVLENPAPTLLLLDWLRSPEVGSTGTKKGCGQGGCGVCTVMLSRIDPQTGEPRHEAINACLRPVCSLDGMAVTTTEGAGDMQRGLSPVQYAIGKENGSQCGYCTPGWVMAMTALLVANGERKPTQVEIEQMLDGNLCRCTGYRPILYALRQFAGDWTPAQDPGAMKCCVAGPDVPRADSVGAPNLPKDLGLSPIQIRRGGHTWYRATSVEQTLQLLSALRPDDVQLVHGNTSIGVYDRFQEDPRHLIDISNLEILKRRTVDQHTLNLGGGVTYSELLAFLDDVAPTSVDPEGQSDVEALRYVAQRTAGAIVRNVATLAGNTMMVVRHVHSGVPFPSDLFTALAALDASVELAVSGRTAPLTMPILAFAEAWQTDETLKRAMLLGYVIPRSSSREFVRAYKVALREVNAHSIVNAGCKVRFGADGITAAASIVIGGVAPVAFHAREAEHALTGKPWGAGSLTEGLKALRRDIDGELERWRDRLSGLPNEGFSDDYRRSLAESFLYKFFVDIALATGARPIAADIASAGLRWRRPVSHGVQSIPKNRATGPVGKSFIKLDAFLQATGEALYTHDLPLPARGVDGAFVLSNRAAGQFIFQIPDRPHQAVSISELRDWLSGRFVGLVAILTANDIPKGKNNQTPQLEGLVGGVDPLLAQDRVDWYGQPVALVLAETQTTAIDVAQFIRTRCLAWPDPTPPPPLLTIESALAAGSVFADTRFPPYNHIHYVERPNSDLAWAGQAGGVSLGGKRCLIINGVQRTGSQAHYYMETQSALAVPGEQGAITVHASTQSPDSVQSAIANLLGLPLARVAVTVRRVGGGYGGKTMRPPYVAAPAALAASQLGRPVRILVRREEDMEMIGRRHPFQGEYSVAVATGEDDLAPRGKIEGLVMSFVSDGGATYDCSFVVMDCVQLRIDSGYFIPNWKTKGQVARTNLASNTAFRSMGLIQAVLILEDAIAQAAHRLGMRAEDVREINLYAPGDTTIIGTKLDICYLRDVWRHLRSEASFDRRAAEVERFNQANRWRKRGIAMIPVQYGAGYNAAFLEQAGAMIEVFDQDGSVLIHQGGVEIGQGLATKVAQVAAATLNVPLELITVGPTDLGVVPNPVGTGGSTGSGFNSEAVRAACLTLRRRLARYCRKLKAKNGEDWCKNKGIDYWNYSQGWKASGSNGSIWKVIVGSAHFDRVNLSAQVRIPIPGGSAPAQNIYPTSSETAERGVDQFTGYTFSAGCAEVEVDVLTGETTIVRADLLYDTGESLNPAIDVGQIEGAFIQGVGYLLSEEIIIQPDGPHAGRLNSNNTWGYKIPATASIPLEMNVSLFPRRKLGLPAQHDVVLGSKEVGEPPLVLAASVYLAVKNAVMAARADRGHHDWFVLEAPATVQRVRHACLVEARDLKI